MNQDFEATAADNQVLAEFAAGLACTHLGSRFIGVGNSPGWIVQVLQQFFNWTPRPHDSVPFSGHALKLEKPPVDGVYTYVPDGSKIDEREYRELLRKKGITPRNLIMEYWKTGQRTVFLDYMDKGEGIASFMYVLLRWAQEENVMEKMLEATSVHVYSSADRHDIKELKIFTPRMDVSLFPEASYLSANKIHLLTLASDELTRIVPKHHIADAAQRQEHAPMTAENSLKGWVLFLQRRANIGIDHLPIYKAMMSAIERKVRTLGIEDEHNARLELLRQLTEPGTRETRKR